MYINQFKKYKEKRAIQYINHKNYIMACTDKQININKKNINKVTNTIKTIRKDLFGVHFPFYVTPAVFDNERTKRIVATHFKRLPPLLLFSVDLKENIEEIITHELVHVAISSLQLKGYSHEKIIRNIYENISSISLGYVKSLGGEGSHIYKNYNCFLEERDNEKQLYYAEEVIVDLVALNSKYKTIILKELIELDK